MSAYALTQEVASIRTQTFRTTVASVVFHALLLAFLSLYHEINPGPLVLTEITLLEPGEGRPAAAVSVPAPPGVREQRGIALRPQPQEVQQFERETKEADFAPDPDAVVATEDRLAERLATLQQTSRPVERPAAALVVPGLPGGTGRPGGLAMVGGGGTGSGSAPGLVRGPGQGGTGGAPLVMKRAGTPAPAVPVPAAVPHTEPAPAASAKSEGSVAQRTLAGATLIGPVADRKLLAYSTPKYPEWAKSEGVESTVRLTFFVLPGGGVKENIVVQKTSGYQEFDMNAIEALKTWRFEPLKNAVGEQWGEITFRYRLSDPGRK